MISQHIPLPAFLTRLALAAFAAVMLLVPVLEAPARQTADATPQAKSIPVDRQAKVIAIIPIKGEIDGSRWTGDSVMGTSVKRRINAAVRDGADMLVFEIDTPGGSLGAALDICRAIKQSGVDNTVAWVEGDAISAGAIIALACRHIIVNDPCTFGDAMPIGIGGGGVSAISDTELRKKVLPPVILEILDSVRRHNRDAGRYVRDEYLAMAIVANDVELWWVRNKTTGVTMAIDRSEFEELFPGQDATTPTRLPGIPGGSSTGAVAASPQQGPSPSETVQRGEGAPVGSSKLAGVVPYLTDEEGSLKVETTRPQITAASAGEWELLGKITNGTAAAVLSANDTLYYGLAGNNSQPDPKTGEQRIVPVRTQEDVKAWSGAAEVRRYDPGWTDGLVRFLTNTLVRGILIAIFLLAIFAEMTHPGATVPGMIALFALVLLVAPPFLIGLANWWEIAAIGLGVLLIGVEVLVLPGFGVAGVLGILLLFGGLVGTFVPAGGSVTQSGRAQDQMVIGLVTVMLGAFTAGVGMYFLIKHLGKVPIFGRLVLREVGTGGEEEEEFLAAMGTGSDSAAEVGETGTAQTDLRPSGRILIGDRIVDAIAEIGYIRAGSKVRVVSVAGARVGVEQVA
ncbi:MAG: NfeD family protein [Phycisphaerales bacterium]